MRSMTGFGRGTAHHDAGWSVVVQLRTVNNRFFEFACQLPREWDGVGESLRRVCREEIERGRCEVAVAVENRQVDGHGLHVDMALADQYHQALKEMADRFALPCACDATALAALPGVMTLGALLPSAEQGASLADAALRQALQTVVAARETEGRALAADLARRIDQLERRAARVGERIPAVVRRLAEAWRQRVEALVAELGTGVTLSEERLLLEAGVWAERIDVAEEIVRVQSHLSQFRAIMDEGRTVGRRCDFLAQELYREWNTIGSKAMDAEVTGLAVEAKTLVEQIREQLQNVE